MMLSAMRVSQRRVDLVGEDVFGERFANRQIETCEQLCQRFTFSAFQHRQGVFPFVGHRDTLSISMPPSSQKRSGASHGPSA